MIGARLSNRYEILRELGRGGMGVVYVASDPLLGREVAIKFLTPNILSPEAVERFQREARTVAQMDHPGIVGVHDIGEHDGSLYIIMPLVKGANLRVFLNEGSMSLGDVIDIGIQVAEALKYSHSNGVVHRDIKPENILATRLEDAEGAIRVRLTDFGLAMASANSRLTKTGALMGTISYLSPEQVSADEIDSRTDIYALGTLLYECLAGRTPFSGEIQSVLYRIAHELPQSPRSLGAQIREEMEEIIMRCLEKDPAKRPQRVGEVAEALTRHRSKLQESDRSQKLSAVHHMSTQPQRRVMAPFVGREKEFGELQRRLNAALEGECQFAVVAAGAGIGKSRLLDELENLAKARKIPVLHGRFVEADQAFPYQGFCDLIQEYFRSNVKISSLPVDFSDLAPELVSLFPMLKEIEEIGPGSTGEVKSPAPAQAKKPADRTAIFELIAGSLIRIAGGKPLVVLLEDLHAANVSVDALQYFVRRLGPTPTLVIVTYRSTEVDKRHPIIRMLDSFHGDRRFVSIRLEPFLPSEHRAFLETLLGSSEMEHGFVERLYEATEGNPYFTRELVRSLIDSGRIVQTDTGSWNLSGETAISSEALPPTIQQTVGKRIERLPKNLREVLTIASVLGKRFELRDLALLAGKKEKVEAAIERLLESGFIEEERDSRGDQLVFSSLVVRDVLYASLARPKRKSLHRKYAEELEKRNQGRLERIFPQLVHHYSRGYVTEKVIDFGLKLTRSSLDAFSAEDAVRSAKIVLAVLEKEDVADRSLEAEARVLLAEAYRLAGNTDAALQELELAGKLFKREKRTSRFVSVIVIAAETAWEGRKVEDAKRWVEKGLDLARTSGDSASILRLLSVGATLANLRGEYEKATEYLEEVDQLQPASEEKQEEIPKGGRLVVPISVPVHAMHPADTLLQKEIEILGNVFETLLTTDANGHLVACLCERWEIFEQGKSFLFTLRENIRMHDGRDLTAREIKASFEGVIRRCAAMPPVFAAIAGVSAYHDGSASEVEGIVVLSKNRLRIDLAKPFAIYPALLTDLTTVIALEVPGMDKERPGMIGTGPYRIASFQSDCIVLERNEDYWRSASAMLDAIEFRPGLSAVEIASGFRSGQFDLASNLLPEDMEEILRDRRQRAGFVEAPQKQVSFVLFNHMSPILQDSRVRLALCGVVRTQDLVRATLGRFAQPAEGLIPPGVLGHDPGRRRHAISRDRALELIRSSGQAIPIRLKAAVSPTFQDRDAPLTSALFRTWSDIGVEVSNETPTKESWLEKFQKDERIDLLIAGWNADYDDPDAFTSSIFDSRIGFFRNFYSSVEMDRLIEEAREESRPVAREKLYRRIENLLMEEGHFLPLFHEIDYRIASPKVRGLALRSSPPYVNYAQLGKAEAAAPAVLRKAGGGIIHVPFADEVENLDPSLASMAVHGDVLPVIFEPLTCQGEGVRITPLLSSNFHVEEGGKAFHFRLREDVRFHDGRRMTSRDVRYSFERLLLSQDSPYQGLLSPIRGAMDLVAGNAGDLKGFQIVSTSEFRIDLEQPMSFFPALLSYPAASIIPEGTGEFGKNWRQGCVGTGPFRVVRFEPGHLLQVEANPDYWRQGYPKNDGLIFTFGISPAEIQSGFRAGRFSLARDLSPPDVEALRHESDFASGYRETPRLSTYFVAFNIHRGPLCEEALRHQLVRVVDIEGLVRQSLGRLAIPAHSLIPPGLLGYEPARQMNVPAWQEEPVEQKVELTAIATAAFEGPYSALASALLKASEAKGFRVQVPRKTKSEWQQAMATAAADLCVAGWNADYPDADSFIDGLLHSERGWVGRFCGTPEIDRLIEKGRTETNPEMRHDIYREVEEIIARRALLLPLFYLQGYCFARPEIEGLEVTFAWPTVPYEKLRMRR